MQREMGRGLSYLAEFKCIGSECTDNCCIGWDVDFDEHSFDKYQTMADPDLVKIVENEVYVKAECFNPVVDYAGVYLKKNKRCPFLDESNWCKIQSRYGEGYLSNVCATFPRYFNSIDGIIEQVATLSCPEIARLALLPKTGPQVIEMTYDPKRYFLTFEVSTQAYDQKGYLKKPLIKTREMCLTALGDRHFPMTERLLTIAQIIDQEQLTKKRIGQATSVRQMQKQLLKALDPTDKTLSKVYLEYAQLFTEGLKLSGKSKWNIDDDLYQEGIELYYKPFMTQSGHMIENYFTNFFYKNVFPYSPFYKPFEMMTLVFALYWMIELHMVGLGLKWKGLNAEKVCLFLSAFSKAVEHHNTFMDDAIRIFAEMKIHSADDLIKRVGV